MKTEVIKKNNAEVAVVSSDELLITDVQSALDLIMTVKYETGCTNIAVNKEAIVNDFFVLSTCLAGEILQKFINYGVRFAIYGDFSKYTSKPLRDFMYDSNKGKDIYFQPTASLAVDKLSECAENKKETVMNADLKEYYFVDGKTSVKYLQTYIRQKDYHPELKKDYFFKLSEEVGELAKAMRKDILYKDSDSIKGTIDEEIWDVIYYALAIANCYDIDVESVIKIKEEINNQKYNTGIVFEENH